MSTVFESTRTLSAQELLKTSHSEVRVDWHGVPLRSAFRWSLARDAERLWMSLELPASPPSQRAHSSGEFVEGLAEADVVECFLMSPSGRYQEWHVSPDGAWWAMSFTGYRERDPDSVKPSGITVEVFREKDLWRGVLSVPSSELSVQLDDATRVHVSGIIRGLDGSQTFLSSAGVQRFTPDFHDSRCFEHVRFCRLEAL